MKAAVVSFACGLAVFGTCLIARAQDSASARVEIAWNAPPGCMTREAAQAALDRAIGGWRSDWAVARVTITSPEAGQWSADLWMYGAAGGGERTIHGASCAQVAEAAILIVALAFEAQRDRDAQATVAAAPEIARTGTIRGGVGLRVAGDVGSLPEPDLGMALTLALQSGRLRGELEGALWLPRSIERGPTPGSGGEFWLYTGGLRGCLDVLPLSAAYAIEPCLAAELGATVGSGIGISHRDHNSVFWGAGLLGLSARFLGVRNVWIGVLGELGVPFHRPEWQIDDYGTVFQPSAVLGRVSISAGWWFP